MRIKRCARKGRLLPALPVLLLAALLLLCGKAAAEGASRGLALCLQTLLPTLFPFLVLSELLVLLRPESLPIGAFSRPVAWLFGISRQGAAAVLTGLLCGAPVGTVTAEALCRQGEINDKELARLILLVNNPSIGFLVGAVGGVMLGSTAAGVALFVITWASAATIGILIHLFYGKASSPPICAAELPPAAPFVTALTGSITRGFAALLRIFSFVIFFSCVSACLAPLLAVAELPNAAVVLLSGLLEITAGINEAVRLLPPESALRMAAFFAGFSGFSVCMQVFSVTERHRLPVLPYLAARTAQGLLALLLTELYLRLCHPSLRPLESLTAFAQYPGPVRLNGALLLPVVLLVLLSTRKRAQKKRR